MHRVTDGKVHDVNILDEILPEAGAFYVMVSTGASAPETQWWYFDNKAQDANGGMPYYDQDTINDFAAAKGHQIWPFRANTDDPKGDLAHQYETADFLRDRIWAYCQDVITYVRGYHPTTVFECLWPLDANQGAPKPSAKFRALNFYVNLSNQWKNFIVSARAWLHWWGEFWFSRPLWLEPGGMPAGRRGCDNSLQSRSKPQRLCLE